MVGIKKLFWNALLIVSPDAYEKRKARAYGFTYPDYFDSTRSIFVHIPKAAGTSISLALYGRQIIHHPWQTWYGLNPKKFQSYFKFAVLRNPISRFNSAFDFLKADGMNKSDREFSEAVLKPFADANELAESLVEEELQSQVLAWQHFKPQADFVADKFGNSKMDMLVRFENLAVGYDLIAKKVGTGRKKLPHLNKTKHRTEADFTPDARQVLECVYQKDFVLWNNHAS